MKALVAVITVIAVLLSSALALPLPQPMPPGPGGSCAHGWSRSGSFCVPRQGAQDTIPLPPNCPFPNCTGADLESVPIVNSDSSASITLFVPRTGIQPSEVAVIVNDQDSQSTTVGAYFQQKHGIPAANVIHVSFSPGSASHFSMDSTTFAALKSQVDAQLSSDIQAYAITWTFPYAVGAGMSITSAFAFGYDDTNAGGSNTAMVRPLPRTCNVLPQDPYFDSASVRPYTDYNIRPAMMIAGSTTRNATNVIDRGVLSAQIMPSGTGYFLDTSDVVRSNPRIADFQNTVMAWNHANGLTLNYLVEDYIQNMANVLFYETGLTTVPKINTNHYLPGSVADHLTSGGGNLESGQQMDVLAWLEAGATASYGEVVEPCARAQKFPQASVLVSNYFSGNTVVEAYTKSVQMPGEGLFVGDPLARPFGTTASFSGGALKIKTSIMQPGSTYSLYGAASAALSPVRLQNNLSVSQQGYLTITDRSGFYPYYELLKTGTNWNPLFR